MARSSVIWKKIIFVYYELLALGRYGAKPQGRSLYDLEISVAYSVSRRYAAKASTRPHIKFFHKSVELFQMQLSPVFTDKIFKNSYKSLKKISFYNTSVRSLSLSAPFQYVFSISVALSLMPAMHYARTIAKNDKPQIIAK